MSEVNIFEQATRRAFRFNYRGLISTEDLWQLKLSQLNEIAVELYKQTQQQVTVSFIDQKTSEDEELNLKLEVVKHIITVKLAERDAAKQEVEKRQQKQRILELINQKQDQALSELSVEELQARLNEL